MLLFLSHHLHCACARAVASCSRPSHVSPSLPLQQHLTACFVSSCCRWIQLHAARSNLSLLLSVARQRRISWSIGGVAQTRSTSAVGAGTDMLALLSLVPTSQEFLFSFFVFLYCKFLKKAVISKVQLQYFCFLQFVRKV